VRPHPPPRVLFGAGRQAGHALNLLESMGGPWQNVVLFDDAHPQLQTGARGRPVLGTLEQGIDYCVTERAPALVALGSKAGARRYAIFRALMRRNVELTSLVHPSCHIAPSAKLGVNVIMMPGCVVMADVTIGSLCCLFSSVTLEHDVTVGDNVLFGPGVVASGYVRIGRHAFVGAGAVCAPEVTLGERALVGAGAVVVADASAGSVSIGVPARFHRPVAEGDDAPTLVALQQWGCAD
jgi:sugar O-acyltransferase (sialic acid O-acetyltransferase NeuD family)